MTPEERKATEQEVRRLFHELWTEEVGTEIYNRKRKEKWMDLQVALQLLGIPV